MKAFHPCYDRVVVLGPALCRGTDMWNLFIPKCSLGSAGFQMLAVDVIRASSVSVNPVQGGVAIQSLSQEDWA